LKSSRLKFCEILICYKNCNIANKEYCLRQCKVTYNYWSCSSSIRAYTT